MALFSDTAWRAAWRALWQDCRDYLGAGKQAATRDIGDLTALADYLYSRASFISQTCLYGYLKTRAGTRYPELFDNPNMLVSINIAKWQIFVACLSDLSIYIGGLLHSHRAATPEHVRALLGRAVNTVLAQCGHPTEAGEGYADSVEKLWTRLAHYPWHQFVDGHAVFVVSPPALLYWAPIADELKRYDREIVHNSLRFRWQEIRHTTRRRLHVGALWQAYLEQSEG